MIGRQWLPWIHSPAPASASATSVKQEQEISSSCFRIRKPQICHHFGPVAILSTVCSLLLLSCVSLSVLYYSESDPTPEWQNLLFDYQNISGSFFSLTKTNDNLRRTNEILKKRTSSLDERAELLNKTSAGLVSVNAALTLELSRLKEQVVNQTAKYSQIAQEHGQLVRYTSEQREEKQNMSETIKRLEDEKQHLSEIIGLLGDELLQSTEQNQELLGMSDGLRNEIKNLSEDAVAHRNTSEQNMRLQERLSELQELNQNLSTILGGERQEAAERERSRRREVEQMEADVNSTREAYRSLDLYCPVVDQKTKERVCKKCQNSWRPFQSKCYYFSSRLLTWSSSRSWCRARGGDLLVVSSEPEQNFIFESSQTLEQKSSRLWIGMTDAEVEGEWRWVDGSRVSSDVQFWLGRPGTRTEPDDWKLDDPLGEDCGHIDTSEDALKSWMDGSCKTPYRWICEKTI
ncbi:CD209 antigen-like [Mugil cephalus]|uniref:CD209 antigen-like n=1 Tax=Mugil cephalus TaxID=48193 RepID=UPI001FB7087A|nr:CD209 antigen-like [Mugil cephalus]